MKPSAYRRLEKMHNLGRRRFLLFFVLMWSLLCGLGNVIVYRHAYWTDIVGTTVMNILFNAMIGIFFLGPFAWAQMEKLYDKEKTWLAGQGEDDGSK